MTVVPFSPHWPSLQAASTAVSAGAESRPTAWSVRGFSPVAFDAPTLRSLTDGSRLGDRALLRSAVATLERLEALSSADPAANSLHDYLTHQVAAAAVRQGEPSVTDRLLALLTRGPGLQDLDDFCLREGLSDRFRLAGAGEEPFLAPETRTLLRKLENQGLPANIKSALERYVATLDLKRRGVMPPDGLRERDTTSLERLLGALTRGLATLPRSGAVAGALQSGLTHPTGFLRINRLAHLLLRDRASHGYEHKIAEFRKLPTTAPAYDPSGVLAVRSPDALRGTIHTGFFADEHLARVVRAFWASASVYLGEPLADRSLRWRVLFSQTGDLGDVHGAHRLAALLKIHNDRLSRALSDRVAGGRLPVVFLTAPQMADYAETRVKRMSDSAARRGENVRYHVSGGGVQAAYEHPLLGDSAPRVVLLDLFREQPWADQAAIARDVVANLRHEGGHIVDQLEGRGAAWQRDNFDASEIEESLQEILLHLAAGDENHFRDVSSLSAFGPVMGLRNFVEQVYWRARAVPKI